MSISYNVEDDWIRITVIWGGGTEGLNTAAFTENYSLKRPMILLFSWDSDQDLSFMALDGKMIEAQINTGAPTSSDPTEFRIGMTQGAIFRGDFIIDEIKTFSEAVLPFGAYFIGNGEVDTSVAHADILTFIEGDESDSDPLKIGTGNIDINGATQGTGVDDVSNSAFLIDGSSENIQIANTNMPTTRGAIAFWFKHNSAFSSSARFIQCDDTNGIDIYRHSTTATTWYFKIAGDTAAMTTIPDIFTTDLWHWIKFTWDADEDYRRIYIDSILEGESTVAFGDPSYSSTCYFGNTSTGSRQIGGYMDKIFITSNPDTPEIWTAFGKPLHIDLVKKNGVYQQYGA
jgi:hypothetical protein